MPHKPEARLRELLDQMKRAQNESRVVADRARRELAGMVRGGDLKPVGTSGTAPRKRVGRKKR